LAAIFVLNKLKLSKIIFSVTNELLFDQRMQRICASLSSNGYNILLVGSRFSNSTPLEKQPFRQHRLFCFFKKGILFYSEYNLRLLWFLIHDNADAFCAIDLDTILPNLFASIIRRKPRVYDAHELFTEQKEIVTRKFIHSFWLAVEKFAVPKFKNGYTVNLFIKEEFNRRYGIDYGIIRNMPMPKPRNEFVKFDFPTLIYQGAVNEGRSFETLIPAMKHVDATLLICGKGNYLQQAKALVSQYELEDKVIFKGAVPPNELWKITQQCHIGIMLFEATGLNQFYSLANRFFDYMMAGIPQICVNYPEYKAIVDIHPFAYMIDDTKEATISHALNNLLNDAVLYNQLTAAAKEASNKLNWLEEEKLLVHFWNQLVPAVN